MNASFAIFAALIFVIPSLIISAYALLIYRFISVIKSRTRILIPPALALILAALQTALSIAYDYNPEVIIALSGYLLLFIYGTEMAAGIITPVFIFEGKTTKKQRSYMVIAFAAVLAILLMRGFASAMGTPSPTVGLLGLVNYKAVLKLGKIAFHFISAILPYLELMTLSAIFYAFCYSLVLLMKGADEHGGNQ